MKQYVTFLQEPNLTNNKITNTDLFLLSKGTEGTRDQRLLIHKHTTTRMRDTNVEKVLKSKKYRRISAKRFYIDNEIDYLKERYKNIIQTYGSKNNLYYEFKIPKRSGGWRNITAPIDDLKHLQKQTVEFLTKTFELIPHHNAHAYTKERSIKTNAETHKYSNHFGNVDLEDFFPSITSSKIRHVLTQIDLFVLYEFNHIIDFIIDISTLNDKLPQGTPLSPLISNLIMIPFDYHISEILTKRDKHIVVTRYADDITFSSFYPLGTEHSGANKQDAKDTLHNFIHDTFEIAYGDRNFFNIKYDKSKISTNNGKNRITGVKVNQKHDVSIGYKEKRQIKQDLASLIIAKIHNEPEPKPTNQVIGMYNFLHAIEPTYAEHVLETLRRKFNLPTTVTKFIT
jgi:RNA-directed DNA polymerase